MDSAQPAPLPAPFKEKSTTIDLRRTLRIKMGSDLPLSFSFRSEYLGRLRSPSLQLNLGSTPPGASRFEEPFLCSFKSIPMPTKVILVVGRLPTSQDRPPFLL